jgi:pyruvate formate lyase activating enzyme
METELTGKVYDIQGFSIQDGPGIRTTVFFKGCPLCCPWCHSPESQSFAPQLAWLAVRCLGIDACGRCLPVCPRGALSPGELVRRATGEEVRLVRIDRSSCDACGACTRACYPKALEICGTDYTLEELLARVLRDRPFYENSGGGVTVSGGEPLCQPEFVLRFLEKLKEQGIHTALDTTGHVPADVVERALAHTDLFLYDLKQMDGEIHRAATGVSNERILHNARLIAARGGKMQVRVPVIPDFNDSDAAIRAIGVFCLSLGAAVEAVQLLPYHNLGVVKYQRIENRGKVLEAVPPSEARMRELLSLLEDLGLGATLH